MELDEKFDDKYIKDKRAYEKLEKVKEQIKKTEQILKRLGRQKEDAERNKERAIEDKDKTAEENAKAAIKLINEEIEKEEANVTKMKSIVSKSKEKVTSYIEELSKDPEFKAHINSILEKRYNRKIKKAMHDKEQTDLILNLCQNHPSLENNLKGMVHAEEEAKRLDEELKKLDPVNDKARIDQIKNIKIPTLMSKKKMNERSFMDFCTKNNVNIDKEYLKKLVNERKFAHDKKTNEILIYRTLKNTSKGYDKQINTYKKSIEKIPGAKIYEVEKKENTPQTQGNIKEEESKGDNLPANKFKWWQFRKRFNNWKERRNVKKEEKQNEGKTQESAKKFRDAYKYTIVQDYVEKAESAIGKQVYKESKKQNEKDEEER